MSDAGDGGEAIGSFVAFISSLPALIIVLAIIIGFAMTAWELFVMIVVWVVSWLN